MVSFSPPVDARRAATHARVESFEGCAGQGRFVQLPTPQGNSSIVETNAKGRPSAASLPPVELETANATGSAQSALAIGGQGFVAVCIGSTRRVATRHHQLHTGASESTAGAAGRNAAAGQGKSSQVHIHVAMMDVSVVNKVSYQHCGRLILRLCDERKITNER